MAEHKVYLSKTQRQLLLYWQQEINAIKNQLLGAISMLSNQVQAGLFDSFRSELNVDPGWIFDKEEMAFKPRQESEKKPPAAGDGCPTGLGGS